MSLDKRMRSRGTQGGTVLEILRQKANVATSDNRYDSGVIAVKDMLRLRREIEYFLILMWPS